MYSKPEIMEKMELTRASCRAELEFWNNITFLVESAGNAKELVFDMIEKRWEDPLHQRRGKNGKR